METDGISTRILNGQPEPLAKKHGEQGLRITPKSPSTWTLTRIFTLDIQTCAAQGVCIVLERGYSAFCRYSPVQRHAAVWLVIGGFMHEVTTLSIRNPV